MVTVSTRKKPTPYEFCHKWLETRKKRGALPAPDAPKAEWIPVFHAAMKAAEKAGVARIAPVSWGRVRLALGLTATKNNAPKAKAEKKQPATAKASKAKTPDEPKRGRPKKQRVVPLGSATHGDGEAGIRDQINKLVSGLVVENEQLRAERDELKDRLESIQSAVIAA